MSDDRDRQKQQVAALRQGTVVDHLNPGTALRALEVLGVPREGAALLGINLESKKLGRKDILKLENVEITQEDIDRIALFGPRATVCFIRDYVVHHKVKVQLTYRVGENVFGVRGDDVDSTFVQFQYVF